uniref:Uncharacterized protein n=1 Tax=Anguilla anguilla TaxID=7936 RepID=A0A0E9PVX7_ANGAN
MSRVGRFPSCRSSMLKSALQFTCNVSTCKKQSFAFAIDNLRFTTFAF